MAKKAKKTDGYIDRSAAQQAQHGAWRPLTVREANRLARGRARVTRCPEDRRLWRVEGDGWVEVFGPMTRLAWQTFLAEKVDAETPERHESVAYSGDAAEVMVDVLRDVLSPQTVAAIVACLQPARTQNDEVNRQLAWFAQQLTELVGGHQEQGRLAQEGGL